MQARVLYLVCYGAEARGFNGMLEHLMNFVNEAIVRKLRGHERKTRQRRG
jgi:hypothetical protein